MSRDEGMGGREVPSPAAEPAFESTDVKSTVAWTVGDASDRQDPKSVLLCSGSVMHGASVSPKNTPSYPLQLVYILSSTRGIPEIFLDVFHPSSCAAGESLVVYFSQTLDLQQIGFAY